MICVLDKVTAEIVLYYCSCVYLFPRPCNYVIAYELLLKHDMMEYGMLSHVAASRATVVL